MSTPRQDSIVGQYATEQDGVKPQAFIFHYDTTNSGSLVRLLDVKRHGTAVMRGLSTFLLETILILSPSWKGEAGPVQIIYLLGIYLKKRP